MQRNNSNTETGTNTKKSYARIISYALYIFLQCTWGLPQTLAGLVFFLISIRCPHQFYHGCIKTTRSDIGGVSLGLFIFVSDKEENDFSSRASVHEFGHTIQSLILGPLYLFTAGAASMLWCGLPYFKKMRSEKRISYNDFFVESSANALGEKLLHEASTKGLL